MPVMKYRKLRIAWSVAWGVVAVLLCVLWVRSYSFYDGVHAPLWPTDFAGISSQHGYVQFWTYDGPNTGPDIVHGETLPIDSFGFPFFLPYQVSSSWGLRLPFWFVAPLSAAIAALPWLPRRFSLRTLLIATMLVAIVLGLVVYFGR